MRLLIALLAAAAAFGQILNDGKLKITTDTLPGGAVGTPYSATLLARNGKLPLTWNVTDGNLPPGLDLSASTGVISGTPAQAGSFNFTIRVTDSGGERDTRAFTIAIAAALAITTSSLPNGTAGMPYSAPLAATGGFPPYTWSATGLPSGLGVSGSSIAGTPAGPGDYSVQIQARDNAGATVSTTLSLTIAVAVPPLGVTATTLPSGIVGKTYVAALSATGGVPPYTWTVAGGSLPPGVALDTAGRLSGTPAKAGDFSFRARVTDSGSRTAERDFSIRIAPALVLTGGTLPQAEVGSNYSHRLTASGGTTPYSWTIQSGSLPDGLALDSSSGVISGTPTSAGSRTFTVAVGDSAGRSTSAAFTLNVVSTLSIASPSPLPAAAAGTTYSYSFAALGGTPPYTWSVSGGRLPSGLSLNSSTGVLSGTPTQSGTYTFTVRVTDSGSAADSGSFNITVAAALAVATSDLPPGAAGAPYSTVLQAVAGTSPYTWSLTSGSLPPGLALATNGTISGTPSSSGAFSFTIQVRDSAGATASRPLTITISSELRVTTAATLPAGSIGTAYLQRLEAAGGTPPYSWTLTSGSLPPGITLNGADLRGTPTTAGVSQFTVRVTDSKNATASQPCTLQIAAENLPRLTMSGTPATAQSLEQPAVTLALTRAFSIPLSGRLTLAFEPDADNPADDPAIQFSTGGRSVDFTIPANSTRVNLPAGLAVQTGSVAGNITLSAALSTAGGPAPDTWEIRVARAAPSVRSARIVTTATGFEVWITGFSNTRELENSIFEFQAGSGTLQTVQAHVDYGGTARQWFQDAASKLFGAQFTIVQPFTVTGDRSVLTGVKVTLTNSMGPSQGVSAQF